MYTIVSRKCLTPDIIAIEVEAPRIASAAKPGQFVIVRAGEQGERVPLTIAGYDAVKGTVLLVVQMVGASTRRMGELQEGQHFTDLTGPLGIPSDFMECQPATLAAKRYLFIAGGVGAAPVLPQAAYLFAHGAHVEIILGARNKDMIILEEDLRACSHQLHICTDDGSYGRKGLVTEVAKELLDGGNSFDRAVAIGPMIMMKFVAKTLEPYRLPLIVSLNTLMVDGTGMCGACRVSVGGKTRFACVDGPEFNAYEVDFDEALRRGTLYKPQEREADHVCRALQAWNKKQRVPVREQAPTVRARNFDEVCLGYNADEAMAESGRCLQCKKPLCVTACPVGIDIPGFIGQIRKGDPASAFRILSKDSTLAAVCGRVCPQETQCEGSCIMGKKADPVAIGKLERYVADWAYEHPASVRESEVRPRGGKMAVVGSGPAGLACAADLARAGVEVTVFEALHKAGGVLVYGIPEFRLPKQKVLARELEKIRQLGVHFETNVVVGRTLTLDSLLEKEGYRAVFIASGAGLPKFMGIPGENYNGVFSANEFLARNNLMAAYDPQSGTPVFVGKHVAVVGGGNVAMDAARTALRLGAKVTVVYRRTEVEMPARVEEVHHAREEGVNFELLTNPVAVLGDANHWVSGLRCIRMELGAPDASGRRSPVEISGSEFDLECDTVIIALGTVPNPIIACTTPGLEVNRKQGIVTDADGRTSRPGIYAGGDAVSGAATVILAMGAGRRAAAAMLKDING